MAPGESGFAQLILEKKDVVVAGDHFVLRSYSPITTIGGGLIIDPLPPKHKRLNKKVIKELATLLNGTLPKKIEVILERAGFAGTNLRHLAFRLGTSAKNIKEALQSILSQKSALITDKEEKAMTISCLTGNQISYEEIILLISSFLKRSFLLPLKTMAPISTEYPL